MSKELRIVKSRSRSFQCDIAGCRNKTTNLVSRRSDVVSRPLHLCDDCIDAMYAIVHANDNDNAHTDSAAVPLLTDTVDVPSGGDASLPVSGARADDKGKTESKPNRAKKAPAQTKKGGKA